MKQPHGRGVTTNSNILKHDLTFGCSSVSPFATCKKQSFTNSTDFFPPKKGSVVVKGLRGTVSKKHFVWSKFSTSIVASVPDTSALAACVTKKQASSRGAEAASTAAAPAVPAPAASPATQPDSARPPNPTASSTGAQPRVAEKGFPLQVRR